MSTFENVDIVLKDGDTPVAGALVKVMRGVASFGVVTTDADGVASFLLESGYTYEARFHQYMARFPKPRVVFEVLEAPATNTFDVPVELLTDPRRDDPRISVGYGFFRRADGGPGQVALLLQPVFKGGVLEGATLLGDPIRVTTNTRGYLEVPLLRFGQYQATLQAGVDQTCLVEVPDAPNFSLTEHFYLTVGRVVLSSSGPFSLVPDGEVTITYEAYFTNERALTPDETTQYLRWTTSDPNVAAVAVAPNKLILRALAAGSCELRLEQQDRPARIPDPGISGAPVSISVS